MTNHVPDEALAALDAFGRGHLEGSPPAVRERLRGDLRLAVDPPAEGGSGVIADCRFHTTHSRRPATLRERGSYVRTIVDGVDDRLRAWGVRPPAAYEYAGTDDGVHEYAGRLRLP